MADAAEQDVDLHVLGERIAAVDGEGGERGSGGLGGECGGFEGHRVPHGYVWINGNGDQPGAVVRTGLRRPLMTARGWMWLSALWALAFVPHVNAGVTFLGMGVASDGTPLLPEAVSYDGSVIAGRILANTGDVPILWTRSGGAERMGAVFGLSQAYVRAISGDGTTISVDGLAPSSQEQVAYAWSASGGRRAIDTVPGESVYAHGSKRERIGCACKLLCLISRVSSVAGRRIRGAGTSRAQSGQ